MHDQIIRRRIKIGDGIAGIAKVERIISRLSENRKSEDQNDKQTAEIYSYVHF